MVAISWVWYNGSHTMAAKPIKSLELHFTMIQFLIIKFMRSIHLHFVVCSKHQQALPSVYHLDSRLVLDNSNKFHPRGTGAAGSIHYRLLSAPSWGICRALAPDTDLYSSNYRCTSHGAHMVSTVSTVLTSFDTRIGEVDGEGGGG